MMLHYYLVSLLQQKAHQAGKVKLASEFSVAQAHQIPAPEPIATGEKRRATVNLGERPDVGIVE